MIKSFVFPYNRIQIIILNWYQRFRSKISIQTPVLNHNFRLRALITIYLLRSWIWLHATFLILLSEIAFFWIFARDKSRWFFPSLSPKKKTFAGGKLSWLQKIVTFLRVLLKINRNDCTFWTVLLAINWNDCSFSQLLLAINRDNFWQKSEHIFATFVGDKLRWLQLFATFASNKPTWLQLFATFASNKSR